MKKKMCILIVFERFPQQWISNEGIKVWERGYTHDWPGIE